MTALEFVYVAPHDWHSIRQRAQQLADGLAVRHRVLFVNPPRSLRHHLTVRLHRSQMHPEMGAPTECLNLHLYQSPPLLPWGLYVDPLNRVNYRILGHLINRQIRRLQFERPILWITHPFAIDLVSHVPHHLCCYDSMDDYPRFYPEQSRLRARLAQVELKLYRTADVVFASSEGLYHKAQQAGANAHLVPNGVDVEHFQLRPGWPAELQVLGRPLLGYIGTIDQWLDQALIESVAKQQSTWHWVLIGPVETDVRRLAALENVHLLGRRPYRDLPAYLACFDVCTIPFKVCPMTWAVNPVKLYEYLAAGKPVVSTPLPEIKRHGSLCYIASSPEAFLESLTQALAESKLNEFTRHTLIQRRVEFAQNNTWEYRVAEIESILVEHLAASRTNPLKTTLS